MTGDGDGHALGVVGRSMGVIFGMVALALLGGLTLGIVASGAPAPPVQRQASLVALKTTTPTTQAPPSQGGGHLAFEDRAWHFTRTVAKGTGGALLLLVIGAGLLSLIAIAQWIIYRQTRIKPDRDTGLLSLSRRQWRALAPQGFKWFHRAVVAEASMPFRNLTHWNAREGALAEIAQPAELTSDALKAPTFPELLKAQKLIKGATPIAWTENGMIQGTPKELRSGGVLAQTGGGKSVLFAEQIGWKRYCGTACFLGDLHAHLDDSTTARLGPIAEMLYAPVAGTKEEVFELVRYLRDAWETIMEGRPHELTDREVHICLDEFTGIAAREALVAPAVDLTARVGSEGGKARWCIWIGGQQGTKAATGGGQARTSLKTRLVLGAEKAEAARWLDVSARSLPDNMKYLDPGECYMMTRNGLIHGQVPWLPDGTMEEMAEAIEARERVEGAQVLRPDPAVLDMAQAAIERSR